MRTRLFRLITVTRKKGYCALRSPPPPSIAQLRCSVTVTVTVTGDRDFLCTVHNRKLEFLEISEYVTKSISLKFHWTTHKEKAMFPNKINDIQCKSAKKPTLENNPGKGFQICSCLHSSVSQGQTESTSLILR